MRKILLVWLTLFVALCAVEGAAIVAVKRVKHLLPICEISVVDIVAFGVLQVGNPAWPHHLVPDLANRPLHRISGAGRGALQPKGYALESVYHARARLTGTRSNGILSRRGLGIFPACHAGPGSHSSEDVVTAGQFSSPLFQLAWERSVIKPGVLRHRPLRFLPLGLLAKPTSPKSTAHPSPSTTPLQEWTNV